MDFKFEPTSMPAASLALFRKVQGTETLYQFTRAADLSLKKVSDLRTAAACGGILLYQPAGQKWVMLAGKVLSKALLRGIDGLGQLRRVTTHSYQRRPVKGWKYDSQYGGIASYGRPATSVIRLQELTSNFLSSGETWVFGVLTSAHGFGYGVDPSLDSFTANADSFAGDFYDACTDDYSADAHGNKPAYNSVGLFGAWKEMANSNTSALVANVKKNGWVLYVELDMGLTREYLTKNKTSILEGWKQAGAPSDEVLSVFEDTYDAAVSAASSATDRFVVQLPFSGGHDGETWSSDLRLISKCPIRWTGSTIFQSYSYGSDVAVASNFDWTVEPYCNAIVQNFAYETDAAAPILLKDDTYSVGITAMPKHLRFSADANVLVRELVATVSPRAALGFEPLSGVIEATDLVSGYDVAGERGSTYGGPATSESLAATIAAERNAVGVGTGMYFGRAMDQLRKFTTVWDQLAQDSGG